jgi:hypothetical protein
LLDNAPYFFKECNYLRATKICRASYHKLSLTHTLMKMLLEWDGRGCPLLNYNNI